MGEAVAVAVDEDEDEAGVVVAGVPALLRPVPPTWERLPRFSRVARRWPRTLLEVPAAGAVAEEAEAEEEEVVAVPAALRRRLTIRHFKFSAMRFDLIGMMGYA